MFMDHLGLLSPHPKGRIVLLRIAFFSGLRFSGFLYPLFCGRQLPPRFLSSFVELVLVVPSDPYTFACYSTS